MTPRKHTRLMRVLFGMACLAMALFCVTLSRGWARADETGVFEEPQGRQLNADHINLDADAGNAYTGRWFAVRWDDIKAGGVAIAFEGKAPALVLANAKRGDWVDVSPSAVSQKNAEGEQVATYAPPAIEAALAAKGRDVDWVGTLMPRVYNKDATVVKRVVAIDAPPLPEARESDYAVPVKLLYTRPVTLAVRDGSDDYTKSVNIDLSNPDVPGHDLVVRYTGDDPQLVITNIFDDKANNKSTWTGYSVADPHAVSYVFGSPSQKVAYFRAQDLNAVWSLDEQVTNKDMTYNSAMISVRNADSCKLVELAVLDVDERVRPTMRTNTLTGSQIVQDLHAGFNFGGALECFLRPDEYPDGSAFEGMTPITASKKDGGWMRADLDAEVSWGNPYLTSEAFAAVKAKGFSAVRVPITWCQHLIDANGDGDAWEIDRAWMARVHEVVDYALDNDLYVIINMHHENWIDRSDIGQKYDEMAPKFAALWTQIADEFAGYDQRLIFESMNEPHAAGDKSGNGMHEWDEPTDDDLATVNKLNQDFVSLIRNRGTASDKNRLLVLSVYGGHPELRVIGAIWAPTPDVDPYVAVSVHPYTPYAYVEGEAGTNKEYTGQHQTTLANVFAGIRSTFTDKGILVIADEYGCRQHANAHDVRKWSYEFSTYAKELGIPTFQWFLSSSGFPPFFDRNTLAWNDEACDPILQPLFEVLADENIAWGGRAHIAASEHESMDAGKEELLGNLPKTLTPESGFSGRFALSAEAVEGKELAVKFSGGTPYLLLLKQDNTGDWWGIAPTSIDSQAHVAYFSGKDIRAASENNPSDAGNNVGGRENLAFGGFRVRGETVTLESVKLLSQKSDLWEEWHEATPVYCTDVPGEARSLTNDQGAVVTTQTIATGEAGTHDLGPWKQVTPPTLTQAGEEKRSCTKCAYEETRKIPALVPEDEEQSGQDEGETKEEERPNKQDDEPASGGDGTAGKGEEPASGGDDPAGKGEEPASGGDDPGEGGEGPATQEEGQASPKGEPTKANASAGHPYTIIHRDNDGVWAASSRADYVVSSDADFSKFVDVLVDGAVVARSQYSVRSGSTVVTLLAPYMATLAQGRHTVTIRSTDGEASTEIVVQTNAPTVARTGASDANMPVQSSRAPMPATKDATSDPTVMVLVGGALLLMRGWSFVRVRSSL